jgi:hypothetical protein
VRYSETRGGDGRDFGFRGRRTNVGVNTCEQQPWLLNVQGESKASPRRVQGESKASPRSSLALAGKEERESYWMSKNGSRRYRAGARRRIRTR